ncbi:MAG: trypsin-like peptidase domain-containing protein [Bacteroidota bacterium]
MRRPSMKVHVLILLALALVGCKQPAQSQDAPQEPAPQRVSADRLAETADANIGATRRTAIVNAVEVVAPAVVSVNVIEVQQVRYRDPFAGDPFFEYFFGRRRDRVVERQVQGLGSGFVISPDGYIVTNDHVAGNATKITVAFPDGGELDATLIGSDPESDIALLKVEPPSPLPYLQFRQNDDIVVGEWAIALGNPFGLFEAAEPTVTVGVVSATGRDFAPQQGRVFRDMIQTDAAINRGNSGGPLVNALGEVIGVNTFIFSQSGGSVGLGFAVPATRVRGIVDELQANGFVDRSFYTGLNVRAMNARIARALGLTSARGLIVESVDPASPAESAGIRPYDVIVAIAEQQVSTAEDAKALFGSIGAGETVAVRLLRDGTEQTLTLAIARTG